MKWTRGDMGERGMRDRQPRVGIMIRVEVFCKVVLLENIVWLTHFTCGCDSFCFNKLFL